MTAWASSARYSSSQRRRDQVGVVGTFGEQVADAGADGDERVEVEALQSDLDGAGVVEAWVAAEVGVEPLGERRQPLHALGAVEERRGASDDEVQAGNRPS